MNHFRPEEHITIKKETFEEFGIDKFLVGRPQLPPLSLLGFGGGGGGGYAFCQSPIRLKKRSSRSKGELLRKLSSKLLLLLYKLGITMAASSGRRKKRERMK